jgi:peptidoglycan/xylan/chitin deacetylase (PgdA/CDA1 family)
MKQNEGSQASPFHLPMNNMWIKKALIGTGALRLASRFGGQSVAIIMYHSVMSDPSSAQPILGDIIHSTEVFRGQMEVIARQFHAVSLDDVLLFLRGEKTLPSKAVVVTFDDGYADNYLAAKDILDPLGIPSVFYVTVDCIDRQRPPWPSRLRYAFLTSKEKSWSDPDGSVWALTSTEQRLQAFYRAAECCSRLSGTTQETFIDSTQQRLETEPLRPSQRLMLTWDEVRELKRNGHTIGSHTMSHPNMAYISEQEARTELLEARRRLEQELTAPVVHFAYPCPALQPHWVERTVCATRETGYQTAVTTNKGSVKRHDNPLALRRIRPTKTVDGLHWNLEFAFMRRVGLN